MDAGYFFFILLIAMHIWTNYDSWCQKILAHNPIICQELSRYDIVTLMKYLNALNLISGVGPQKMRLLLNHFGNADNIWKADLSELKAARIAEKLAEKIILEKKKIDPDQEWERLMKEKIEMLDFDSPRYPSLLKEIPNPPFILYVKGEMDILNSPMISIVGSRKYTNYGQMAAKTFSRDLARSGITVVSGMAIGIDSFAHRGALDAYGKTIAVLGNGLSDLSIYPRINFNLSREIISQGALISEYPHGISAGSFIFPARNRIIAGLSLGTLVVEAGEKSGTLITANLALDYNREVFAVPGSIFSQESLGSNELIKKGAKLAGNVKDILEEINLSGKEIEKPKATKNPENPREKILLDILSSDPLHIDNIVRLTKLETMAVSSALSMMEIKGWVKNIGGQNYIIT